MLNRLSRRCFCTVAPRPWLFVGLGNPGDNYKGTRHNVGFEMIDAFVESQGISMSTTHCKANFGQGLLHLIFFFVYSFFSFLLKYFGLRIPLSSCNVFQGLSVMFLFSLLSLKLMNLSGESTAERIEERAVPICSLFQRIGVGNELSSSFFDRALGLDIEQTNLQLFQSQFQMGPLAADYKLPLNRVLVFHDEMDLPCGMLHLHHKGGHRTHNGLKSVIYHFRGNKEFPWLRIGIGKPPGQMDPKAFLLQKFNAAARERIDTALLEGVDGLKLLLCKGLTESARRFNTEQKYKHIRLQTLLV